jgi:DNA-binding MarR family transcriptional regulator
MSDNATDEHSMRRYTTVVTQLMRTSDILERYFELKLAKKRTERTVSVIQFAVLNALMLQNGKKTPTTLSKWVFRSPHAITYMLDTLQKKWLLRREPANDDRRSTNIVLTKRGIDTNRTMIPILEEISEAALAPLSGEQIETLSAIVRRIRKRLLTEIGS